MARRRERVQENKAPSDKKARRRHFMAQVGGFASATKQIDKRLKAAREQREARKAACTRATEEIVFRPSYRDPDTGRFVACKGLRPPADNPPRSRRGTEIYAELVEIVARKAGGQLYRHRFGRGRGRSRVPVIGLPDGSLYVPRGRFRLWGWR